MFNKSILAAVVAAGMWVGCADASTVLLFEDNFDSELPGANQSLNNFNITRGLVDVLGAGYFDLYPGTGSSLDLDGTAGSSTIETKSQFAVAPGTYTLSFDLGMNAGWCPSCQAVQSDLEVSFGGWSKIYDVDDIYYANPNSLITGSYATTVPVFTQIVETFVINSGTGLSSLVFSELGVTDLFGAVVDNIRLEYTPGTGSAVPVPGAALFMLSGLGGLLLQRRKARA